MKRTQLNAAIDGVAFAAFLFLTTTGLLLRYQLPPGSGGAHGAGSGHGAAQRPITVLWGWTRHEWGDIHYWLAGFLIAVLAVHVILHWKWIVCVVKGTHTDASGLRLGLGAASLGALVALAAAPLLVTTEPVHRNQLQKVQAGEMQESVESVVDVRGSMTLSEVAAASGLTTDDLMTAMKLPNNVSTNQPVGRVLRQHGLRMSDLRQALAETHTRE